MTPDKVGAAFQKMLGVNNDFHRIEISGNFIAGKDLPQGHWDSLVSLLNQAGGNSRSKGPVYLSPLKDSPKKRELLPRFYAIKEQSALPVFVYLIQRL